jgi:sugar phosphate isomerase/epimerase
LCFPGTTLTQFGSRWPQLGARRISFVSPLLLSENLDGLRAALVAAPSQMAYQVETIAHVFQPGPLTLEEGDWQAARARLARLIGIATALGARSIYMLTGGHGALSWEQAAKAFCAAVEPCVALARKAGIALAIENASPLYADLHIAHTLRDTVTLAEMADVGVCIDWFGCWTEASLRDTIARAVLRCPIIQVSDYVYGDRSLPCRAVPGDGAIPLQSLLEWAFAAGYQGAFDLELIGPRIDREGHLQAVARAGDTLGELLQTLGV